MTRLAASTHYPMPVPPPAKDNPPPLGFDWAAVFALTPADRVLVEGR